MTTHPTDMNSARPPERNLIRNGRSVTETALNFTARTVVFPKAVYRNHAGGNRVNSIFPHAAGRDLDDNIRHLLGREIDNVS